MNIRSYQAHFEIRGSWDAFDYQCNQIVLRLSSKFKYVWALCKCKLWIQVLVSEENFQRAFLIEAWENIFQGGPLGH